MSMKSYVQPIILNRTQTIFDHNIWLAPMSGTSDLPYRLICRQLGAGGVVTELISARGIKYHGVHHQNERYVKIDPAEKPVCIQLFGYDPEDFKAAIHAILEQPTLADFTGIDINMGCPVKKVIQTGAGSALMTQPKQAESIVLAVRSALAGTQKTVSVKFRKGFYDHESTAPDFALRMAECGVDFMTIHGRTAKQMYSGTADHEPTRQAIQALRDHGLYVPIFANGDIVDADSARAVLTFTQADGCMIGRAAMGDPWIFARIQAALSDRGEVRQLVPSHTHTQLERLNASDPNLLIQANQSYMHFNEPSPDERVQVVKKLASDLTQLIGESVAMREMRGRLAHFFKGYKGAVQMRRAAGQINTLADLHYLLEDWKQCL